MRFVIACIAALTLASGVGVIARDEQPAPTLQPLGDEAQGRPDDRRAQRAPKLAQPATPVAPRLELPARLHSRSLRVPILMYHRIAPAHASLPAITRRLTVDPAEFERQMEWLVAHGFQAITQRELFYGLMHGRTLPRRPVIITFDDGYRNVLTHAAPVLDRLRMPAIAYVISGRLTGAGPAFLTCRDVRRLERLGVEIGAHTVSHRDLRALSDADLQHELVASRRALERCVAHPVQWLAYPYGGFDDRVVEQARRAGYVLAVTTVGGTDQRAARPHELRRFGVLDSTGVAGLAGLLGNY
jgi:peptidoglycan/xylan/chitin deacetylase (PgdA/CDA1 family)